MDNMKPEITSYSDIRTQLARLQARYDHGAFPPAIFSSSASSRLSSPGLSTEGGTNDGAKIPKVVSTTNRVAAKVNGSRSTCVPTSFALDAVLRRLGYNSRPLRIEAAVFPDHRKVCGTILGGWREPGCRRAASPGMWLGHFAVVIEDEWLLRSYARPGKQKRMATSNTRRSARNSADERILGRAWLDPNSDERLQRAVLSASAAKWVCQCRRCSAIPLKTAR